MVQTFAVNNSYNQLNTAGRSGTPTSVTVKDNANAAQAAMRYADQSFARAGISQSGR